METTSEIQRTKTNKKRLVGIALFLLLVGGSAFAVKNKFKSTNKRDITSFIVAAESGRLSGLITATGELRAERSVNVSPERQGLLEELYVKEGQRVTKGDVIARMDRGDFLYRLNQMKADFEKEKSAFDRRKSLFSEGAISAEQFTEYKARFLVSKARLEQREVEGSDLIIRAPFSGVITTRYAEPGSFVAPTTRASSIAGSTSSSILELSQGLEVVAKVPESDIGRIRLGQMASVRVDAFPDQRFDAKVSEISPRALKTDNVISFEVDLSLLNYSNQLRIGMTADVNFKTPKTKISTLVPTVAIVTENGQPGVLVVGENQQPKFKVVEIGNSNGSKTAILDGVLPGDQIFIDLPPWAKRNRD